MLNTATKVLNEKIMFPRYEIIGSKKIMAPSANVYHSNAIGEIFLEFKNYFRQHKNGYVFTIT